MGRKTQVGLLISLINYGYFGLENSFLLKINGGGIIFRL
jgi:hypothetical protein